MRKRFCRLTITTVILISLSVIPLAGCQKEKTGQVVPAKKHILNIKATQVKQVAKKSVKMKAGSGLRKGLQKEAKKIPQTKGTDSLDVIEISNDKLASNAELTQKQSSSNKQVLEIKRIETTEIETRAKIGAKEVIQDKMPQLVEQMLQDISPALPKN